MTQARVAAVWGVAGVAASFVEAIARLGARAWETIDAGLSPVHWLALALTVGFFGYFEGDRALRRRYAPFVVARARAIGGGSAAKLVFAPFYAAGLVGNAPRSLLRAWVGVAAIVAAVLLVRLLPFPWRGIVDAGVTVALAWGLVALLIGLRAAATDPGR